MIYLVAINLILLFLLFISHKQISYYKTKLEFETTINQSSSNKKVIKTIEDIKNI